ncbi:MAG: 30S ribosomal protein S1 [Oceanospirillaceae bacterium]|jgi:small subunit ribosomal protein S1|nr:30S ribosomal protein S1 [Oceanospirillaceae bacterium]MBT4443479.1 30S ribosomal protein S1 [Oceanospirillaceae bacterium]MBT7330590.1 30S ribosomal protein S1 [Oceanospirillaceae bacterium]
MGESFADLFEESLQQVEMKKGSLITGVVIAIDSEVVTINVGLKSEGVVSLSEFLNAAGELEVAVGDDVLVALQEIEDGLGATQISRERAREMERWQQLEKIQTADETVTGVISARVKGGFNVELGGIRAFLPGSLIDTRPLQDISHLEGIDLDFKIIKLDILRNNVVVSRRALMDEANKAQREQVLSTLEEGAVVKGFVKNLTDYGAFIDLGGLDGLLHITDIAWRRIKHPSEMLTAGADIEVKVLKFDAEKQRVSLGLKQLQQDPWTSFTDTYPVGSRLPATVTTVTDYGCFARVSDGIEGLVHASEMSWMKRNLHPSKMVAVGDEIEIMILDINSEKRRLSLGMKQCSESPWVAFAKQYSEGDKVTGKLNSKTDFGLFIGLEDGIDGLVHVSDVDWNKSDESLLEEYQKGQQVEAVILSIDSERQRVALGIKQMAGDPFSDFAGANGKGSEVTGIIAEVTPGGLLVNLAEGVQGFLKRGELAQGQDLSDFSEGQSLTSFVASVDRKARSIALAIRAQEAAQQRAQMKELNTQSIDLEGPTTIGDLIKEQLKK